MSRYGGVENARQIFRPLDVAGEPEEVVGRAREHRSVHPHPSSTQVSLVPPPWLELTTSEPFFSATRVSPPGTMRIRRCPTARTGAGRHGAARCPSSTQVGQVESASVGCAMKFVGSALSLARNAAIVGLVGLRPDQHAVAAGAVDFLHHQLVEVVEHIA